MKIKIKEVTQEGDTVVLASRGVLLGILGGGVPPGSPNPDPISDQKCHFPHPLSGLKEVTKHIIHVFKCLLIITGVQASEVIIDRLLRQCCFVWSEFGFLLT